MKCFFVGLALYGVINQVGSVSGGCINPAVGLIQPIFQHVMEQRYRSLFPDEPDSKFNKELATKVPTYTLVYFVACLLGGAFAGIFCSLSAYFAQILSEEDDEKNDELVGIDK